MQATLHIPRNGAIPASTHNGLSDDMALSFGRRAAQTLSDSGGKVIVTLGSGRIIPIGRDNETDKIRVGW